MCCFGNFEIYNSSHLRLVPWFAHWQNSTIWAHWGRTGCQLRSHPGGRGQFWAHDCCSRPPCPPVCADCCNRSLRWAWCRIRHIWNSHCGRTWNPLTGPLCPLGKRFRCNVDRCSRRNLACTPLWRSSGASWKETEMKNWRGGGIIRQSLNCSSSSLYKIDCNFQNQS